MGGIPWTKGEDQLLRKCIEQYGEGKWHRVPLLAGLNRCRKSCRLRWLNYLRPNIKKGSFEEEEIDLIIRLHRLLGNRWSLVAARLPGRTGNDVKNYWNCHLSKKLNAQETEDRDHKKHHYASGRNNVRASNSAATSSSKRPMPLPSTTSLEEDIMIMCSSSTSSMPMPMPTPLPCVRELGGANNPIFQTDEEDKKINPCVEVHDGTDVGDFAMDLIFEQVKENQQDQFNNNWYWDDSILDMDLWNY